VYVDSCTSGKYTRHLLRENYRQDGKVKHRTVANLSRCNEEEIRAIRLALQHKEDLPALVDAAENLSLRQGLSVGAVWLIRDIARQIGIVDAFGPSRQGKLALWQVMARIIDQGSRLSAVRLAGSHAACDILGLEAFDEDDLYANLDWLCEHQAGIEDRLFKKLPTATSPGLFLYDVTSSYLEGVSNELSAFGYNRDGKRGKRQIVIGLLCDSSGRPLTIEVFPGNTQDPQTLASQIKKTARRFGGREVTFVGDRGMIKSRQVKDLQSEGFHYITAITKPQIESLLAAGVFEMCLFDQDLAEVETDEGVRYVLRRNPLRAQEVQACREDKLSALRRKVEERNHYLTEHPRARVDVALRQVRQQGETLRISKWVKISVAGRVLCLKVDEQALAEVGQLDGCYVLKTDLAQEAASKETVHARYKDLSMVEWAFRTSKTVQLEIRPIHVRLAPRTRGHAFVVMLAYRIVAELAARWGDIDLTVDEGIGELTTLCATEVLIEGKPRCNKIPRPRGSVGRLLKAAKVRLPDVLPCSDVRVATRKKLPENRISR